MISKFKTYRLYSALALILFMGSVVLPGSISAATLFCDMPMAEMHNNPQNCCDIDHAEKADHHRGDPADEDCDADKICLHILSPDQSEVNAVVGQQAKKLVAAVTASAETVSPADILGNAEIFSLFSEIPNNSPPIFLLNSTFLN